MKNIVEILKKSYFDELYLEAMKDYFGEDLPKEIIDSANNETYKDYILENLLSHDVNLLCKTIKEKFGKDNSMHFIDIIDNKDTSVEVCSYNDLLKNDDFKNLLKFFGYYITRTFKDIFYHYIISPTYAKNANDLVYIKNHGKLYHFSTGKYSNEIEKTGLRCKSEKYRKYPERIYAYASDKNLDKVHDLFNKINKVIDPYSAKEYGIYIYRIDLNKLKKDNYINFYADDLMSYTDAVYTYNNIPPECIKLVKYFKP